MHECDPYNTMNMIRCILFNVYNLMHIMLCIKYNALNTMDIKMITIQCVG